MCQSTGYIKSKRDNLQSKEKTYSKYEANTLENYFTVRERERKTERPTDGQTHVETKRERERKGAKANCNTLIFVSNGNINFLLKNVIRRDDVEQNN